MSYVRKPQDNIGYGHLTCMIGSTGHTGAASILAASRLSEGGHWHAWYFSMMSAMAWSVSYCISPILKRRRRSWTSGYIESHSDMTKMMKQSCWSAYCPSGQSLRSWHPLRFGNSWEIEFKSRHCMQPEDSVNNRKMRAFTTCVKALNNLMIQ